MQVIVDGEKNFELKGAPEDALAAVAAVNDFLREQGRAIMAVRVDGRDVAANQLQEALKDTPLAEIGTLEFQSEDLSKLVDACLAELEAHLPELPKACRALAELFHSETPEAGFEPFQQLAEIWKAVKERELMVAQALNLKMSEIELQGATLEQKHEELNGFLQEAAQALLDGDCVLIGDLLEYELAPRAEQEAEIVALLQEHAPAQSG